VLQEFDKSVPAALQGCVVWTRHNELNATPGLSATPHNHRAKGRGQRAESGEQRAEADQS
jgi:hypothetical protein